MPIVPLREVESTLDGVVGARPWLVWLHPEVHVGLGYTLSTLAMITRTASRDDILPNVETASRAWDDVIDGELSTPPAAVLAGVIVANEDFPPRKLDPGTWTANEVVKPDNRWHDVNSPGSRNYFRVLLEYFGFATQDKNERAAHIADVERLVILVEDENCVIHPADAPRIRIARFTFAPGTGCNRTVLTWSDSITPQKQESIGRTGGQGETVA